MQFISICDLSTAKGMFFNMLVLTRKINQSITLGENVRVTVLAIEGDRVSIGVDAPRDVRIFRSELLEDTRRTNRESLDAALPSIKALRDAARERGEE